MDLLLTVHVSTQPSDYVAYVGTRLFGQIQQSVEYAAVPSLILEWFAQLVVELQVEYHRRVHRLQLVELVFRQEFSDAHCLVHPGSARHSAYIEAQTVMQSL